MFHHNAAPSCIRAGRLLKATLEARMVALEVAYCIYILRNLCQTHQLMLGTYSVNARTKHIGKLFRATSLIRRGTIYDVFLQQLQPSILSVLEITYEPPTQTESEYMGAICDLIIFEAGHRDGEDFAPPKEYEDAIHDLRTKFFVRDGKGYHFCQFECCSCGVPDAALTLFNILNIVLFNACQICLI